VHNESKAEHVLRAVTTLTRHVDKHVHSVLHAYVSTLRASSRSSAAAPTIMQQSCQTPQYGNPPPSGMFHAIKQFAYRSTPYYANDPAFTPAPYYHGETSSPSLLSTTAPSMQDADTEASWTDSDSGDSLSYMSSVEEQSIKEGRYVPPYPETVSKGSLLDLNGSTLEDLYKQAWLAAEARAHNAANEPSEVAANTQKETPRPSNEAFAPVPWAITHPRRRAYHIYPENPDGSENLGRLRPELYLCSDVNDFGLCWCTLGTSGNCPLGSQCRWMHVLPQRWLRFFIVSGRVSVEFARVLMANWKASESPDLDDGAVARMEAICIGLGEQVEPQELRARRRRGPKAWSWDEHS
jgi:hypothetical protein